MQQKKTAGAVGVFGVAGPKAGLAEEGGLLVAGDTRDGDAVERGDRLDVAVNFAAGADGGENFAGDAEDF